MAVIELPEAINLAWQISTELKGKQIASGVRGSSPHKFAFTGKHSDEEFAAIVKDKTIGDAGANGSVILTDLVPDYVLSLGCGGERILYHTSKKTLPKKHQLLFNFQDGTYLTCACMHACMQYMYAQLEMHAHGILLGNVKKKGVVEKIRESLK